MVNIALSYAMDGALVAESLVSEFEKIDTSLNFEQYPIPGNKGNVFFWNSIKTNILKADIILFICTEEFAKNNAEEIKRLKKLSENCSYRFAWIFVGKSTFSSISKVTCDIELTIKDITNLEDKDKLVSTLYDYFKVVSLVVTNNKELKKRTFSKHIKLINNVFPVVIAYVGIIFCAFLALEYEDSFYFQNSAEVLLIVTAMLSFIFIAVGLKFFISNQQRRMERQEKSDFDKDLDISLSKHTHKDIKTKEYISYLQEIISVQPNISNQLLDYLFAVIRLKQNNPNHISGEDEIFQRVDNDVVDKEITQAIGDSDYIPLGHLKFNWKQMKGYYDISKKQATTSFGWAIAISLLGIIIITFAILSPLIPAFSKENSLLPIIGSVGGAFVELFAGTILLVYIKSLSQMNLYHKALSEYQRYLSCVNLVSKISVIEKQDSLYEEIIREEIKKTDFPDKEEMEKILETPRKIVKK